MVLNSNHYQHRSSHLALYPGSEHYAERMSHEFGPHFLQLHHHLGGGVLHKTSGATAVFNGTGAFRRVVPPDHAFPFHHMQHQRNLLERDHVESLYKSKEHEKELIGKEKISHFKPDKDSDVCLERDNSKSPSPKRVITVRGESEDSAVDAKSIKKEQNEIVECCKSPGSDIDKADGKSLRGKIKSLLFQILFYFAILVLLVVEKLCCSLYSGSGLKHKQCHLGQQNCSTKCVPCMF